MSARSRRRRVREWRDATRQDRVLNPKVEQPAELCWCGCGGHWHRAIPGLRRMRPEEFAAWETTGEPFGHEAFTPPGYGRGWQ